MHGAGVEPEPPVSVRGAALLSLGVTSVGLVIVSRRVAGAFWGTSYLVLGVALVVAAWLWRVHSSLGSGWFRWRHAITALTVLTLAYPGLWATVALLDHELAGRRLTWAFAVLAGMVHLPFIASFSLIPLGAVRYLGTGSTRLPAAVTGTAFSVAAVTFVLFFGEFDPFEGSALIQSDLGVSIGMTANMLALGSVPIGPIWALRAAWRSTDESARRLALVAASALSGVALVMVCGLVGVATDVGTIALFCGMFVAVATVTAGCSRALAAPTLPRDQRHGEASAGPSMPRTGPEGAVKVPLGEGELAGDVEPPAAGIDGLTDRESEVLALLAEGFSNAGIAARLYISERTVDAHLRSVFTKLGLPDTRHDNRRVHAARAWRTANEAVRSDK